MQKTHNSACSFEVWKVFDSRFFVNKEDKSINNGYRDKNIRVWKPIIWE
jgi:hypothetical protein